MKNKLHQICTTLEDMHQLMEELVALQRDNPECCRAVARPEVVPLETEPAGPCHERDPENSRYGEDELMTFKEAMAYIPVGRTKLYEMRKCGLLRTIERSSRQKRLLRIEVEATRAWSMKNGKW